MKKNSLVVDNILKRLHNDYVKIEEERTKYNENLKSKKVQKKVVERQAYIQNIEKKLNEIVAHSMEIKKQDKKPNFSLSHKNLPMMDESKFSIAQKKKGEKSASNIENLKLKLSVEEKSTMKNKNRLCRLFFSTGLCRWGDKCNFAHSIKEIEGEYCPKGNRIKIKMKKE
jgi:hypothetical protein